MQNNNKEALVDGKEHDDDIQKSVSSDIHSSSSGAQTRKQGDKTENKDKGKSPVVTITGFRHLNAEFKECFNNSSNGVNAASSLVSTAGHNFINSTNDFCAAGPSNAAASSTAANFSSQDASTTTHDSDMPNLEDLTHSNDANDVGAEADINNLESIISTRSMARAVRDQGGISQMFNKDFHTCMFDYFLSQEEPKRVHQALKDPSWIEAIAWYETLATYLLENGFQRGTIDQTLFIKKQQKDILLVQIDVDDIIFGATNKALCQSFEKLMKDKF
nr:putative ribonuclease H-like domain-containing protein [Tanacetum cinerariifolium]